MFARGTLPCLLIACGQPAAHVQLAPVPLANDCGKPAASAVSTVRVIAYTSGGELRRTDASIADFPADTEQLGVEVVGGTNATVLATGKTVPLAYGELANGAQIPIAMIPPDGFCRTADMHSPRARPLVAHAGDGVLVVGGSVVSSAEYYDPATASFTEIPLPEVLADDPTALVGASLATLADGRVVLSGGQALTVFDPKTMTFSSPSLIARRLEHASIGVDASHVLVTGGCLSASSTCDAGATTLRSSLEYELDATGKVVGDGRAKPALPGASVRYGARIVDIGTVSSGKRGLVIAGATSDPTTADRMPFAETDDTGMTSIAGGTHAQVAELDGGALLTAFEVDGAATSSGSASILPPEAGDAAPVALAPKLDGARLVAVEDGSVFAIGGDTTIARYVPTTNAWATSTPDGDAPGAIAAPSLVRLADGTVLVVGGSLAGAPTASAWLFRPSLVGPRSGQVVAFADGSGAILTTPAQATATRTAGHLTLAAPGDDLIARVLVGGPRLATGTLTASVHVLAGGGVALIAQQTGPSRALVARLVAGEPARIDRIAAGATTTLCEGATVSSEELALPLSLVVTGDSVSAAVGATDATTKVSCDFSNDPVAPERGSWGIAATAGASVEVTTITVAR